MASPACFVVGPPCSDLRGQGLELFLSRVHRVLYRAVRLQCPLEVLHYNAPELVVDTGTQPIRYVTRKDYTARYPGITPVRSGDHPALLSVRVANLASCEALLRKNGVTVLKPDAGRLLVPPSEAAHLTLEFVQ